MQPYELIRSGRRTLALELRGGRVIVRAPYRTSQAAIDRFVAVHADWIARGLAKQEARAAAHPEPTDAERAAYIRQAKAYLPQRVAYYSERMGLYPTQVRITGARTRFGICIQNGIFYKYDACGIGKRCDRDGVDVAHDSKPRVIRFGSAHDPA